MHIDGAYVDAWGVKFGIVIVKRSAMANNAIATETREAFQQYFEGMPLVLASQDARGNFRYWGRSDLTTNLAKTDPAVIPWARYTFS